MMQRTEQRSGRGLGVGTPGSLVEALRLSVGRAGAKTAVARKLAGRWEQTSYAALWGRVRDVAAGLRSLGVEEGSRVALISRNRPEWPVVDLAAQSLGAVSVPVYPTLEEAQVRHILYDSGAVVVVVEDGENLGKVSEIRADLPELRHVIFMGVPEDSRLHETEVEEDLPGLPHADAEGAEEATGGVILSLAEVEERGAGTPLEGWEEGWRALGPGDMATVIYTSGTTGAPKGVVLTHGNFISNVEAVARALPFRSDDVWLSFLPLSHVFERCGQYLALSLGCSVYYAEAVEKVPENLREVRPTVMLSVPRLYEKMLDRVRQRVAEGPALRRRLLQRAVAAGREKYDLEKAGLPLPRGLKTRLAVYDRLVFRKLRGAVGGRVRFLVAGGARLEAEIGEFFYAAGVKIVEGYGLTETSPVISCNRLPVPHFGTIGLPMDNVEVRIGAGGEIQARGPNVMRGYWNNEEATRETFTDDGFFRTGDIGEVDDEGYLHITDRLKNIIVLSTGKNVAPAPVEAVLATAPSISQAILFGDGHPYVTALVAPSYDVLRKELGTEASDEELSRDEACRALVLREVEEACARFPAYERPKKVALLPRELSHEAGELTPKLSVKLRVVRERYAGEIEGMYT